MDNKLKKCKQCGEYKNLDEYRKYYNKTKKASEARYKLCKTCEAINMRYKYLGRKSELNEQEQAEASQIEEMYDVLREAGLEPPTKRVAAPNIMSSVSDILAKRRADLERREEADVELDTPDELVEWLTRDLQGMHPDTLEQISDGLWARYRPQTGVDEENNYTPIYDDTYRETLNKIQERFDEYTDEYKW